MLCGTFNGYDVYYDVYVTNHAFGRPAGIPDIYGFRGRIVRTGLPEGDASAIRFCSEPTEGYRRSDLAQLFAAEVGRELAMQQRGV